MSNKDNWVGYRCPICKTINSSKVTYCTHCGQWLLDTKYPAEPVTKATLLRNTRNRKGNQVTNNTLKWIVFIFIVLLSIWKMASWGNNASTTPATESTFNNSLKTPANMEKSKLPDLEVIETSSINEGNTRYAVGTVRNNSDKYYSYVQVEINLYDDQGNQVGSTVADTNNLEPGAKWKFKAVVTEKLATKYQIKEIIGY